MVRFLHIWRWRGWHSDFSRHVEVVSYPALVHMGTASGLLLYVGPAMIRHVSSIPTTSLSSRQRHQCAASATETGRQAAVDKDRE